MPNLGAPTQVMFLVSLALVVLAIVSLFVVNIPVISMYGFWVAVIGYAVLAAACLFRKCKRPDRVPEASQLRDTLIPRSSRNPRRPASLRGSD